MNWTLLLMISLPVWSIAQDISSLPITNLGPTVAETSGLLKLDDVLITHNDSGDEPHLYELDVVLGTVTRTVTVANALAQDWEDICADDNYIYIGDFGNNDGVRTNLHVLRVSISDYFDTDNDTVYADTIHFNYVDQVDFEPATYTTNYDAEAMITMNDSLYIFTKNWGNQKTNIYALSKIPGDYSIAIRDSLNTEGLVTGAAYDPIHQEIVLSGYVLTTPFVYLIDNVTGTDFSTYPQNRYAPSFTASKQIEGISEMGGHTYYISAEESITGDAFLYSITFSEFAQNDSPDFQINYVRTANGLMLQQEPATICLYDLNGRKVYQFFGLWHDFSTCNNGVYVLEIQLPNGHVKREKWYVN
jgi:hypothetical protein